MAETIAAVDSEQSFTLVIDLTTGLLGYTILPAPGVNLAYRIWQITAVVTNITGAAGSAFWLFGLGVGPSPGIAYNIPAVAKDGADVFYFTLEPRGALMAENSEFRLSPTGPVPATGTMTVSLAYELEVV
jgi:hypothetical protein